MIQYTGTHRMTAVVLRGSLILSIVLTYLFIIQGLQLHSSIVTREIFGVALIIAFLCGEILLSKGFYSHVALLLVWIYFIFSTLIMLMYGITAPLGILSASFVIFLSGTLLGTRSIKWVVAALTVLLVTVHILHSYEVVIPRISELAKSADVFHVTAYTTILGIFGLVSWLSVNETERSLHRAKQAEETLIEQKQSLADKLDEESKKLRDAQLREMLRIYKFAEIGQSTTATLHELSNLLSELTLDINDIGQQYQRTKAISNAEEGIRRINRLVRQTRAQLTEGRNKRPFNAMTVVRQTLYDIENRLFSKECRFTFNISNETSFKLKGDPLSLSHVITIIFNNALDACSAKKDAAITASVEVINDTLAIEISDNGPGIPPDKLATLFKPHQSTKPHGLGIGLYVTKHIVKYQLGGKLRCIPSKSGACFRIELPKYT
jgi:C4-dicarboxylate-specific signal transduction histidine kinase